MIYLILSAAFNKNSENEFEKILKIGYTKDDGKKSRFDCYITENPTIKILYLIPEADEQDEKNLHHYFRDYLKYGNEWFDYKEEILEFFKTHTTKESLKELEVHRSKQKQQEYERDLHLKVVRNKFKYINPILDVIDIPSLGVNRVKIIDDLLNFIKSSDQEFIDNYFNTTYPDIDFDKIREYDNDVMDIVKQVELLPYFNQKMRYLYSLDMPEEIANKVFDNLLDTNFAKYYYSISKEKAGTLKYNRKQLEAEYNRVSSISSTIQMEGLTNEIYSNFLVGMKYPKSYIKEKLKEIYDKLGYSKTAKANDIEDYFEVKLCNIPNNGKYDKGFELIKKR